jgi:hypothetical protein
MKRSQHIEKYYFDLCQKLNEQVHLLEKILAKKIEKNKKESTKKLDPIGKEDEDIDNDGKPNTSTDKYLKNRREKIKASMMSKKKNLKEGTVIGNDIMHYGGFPRLLKENNRGAVNAFNDADDMNPRDEKIATHPDTITWTAEFQGTKYPSQSYANLAAKARTFGEQLSSAHERARSQFGPNYMQRTNFMQQPETISLLQQRNAAEEAVKRHPHFAEAQKGHPSTRMAALSKEERDLFELESQYGTSYTLDPVTRKPVYGPRNPRGLGT